MGIIYRGSGSESTGFLKIIEIVVATKKLPERSLVL